MNESKKIRPSGGYRELRSFQTSTIIYDATYWFCERFLEPRSRMSDQMVQAARSGRQNIAEGNRAAATSSQTELRLINVARSSLEELLLDYEDFLRHRHFKKWEANDHEALEIRRLGQKQPTDLSSMTDEQRHAIYAKWLDHENPAIRANALICLIHQANYLLDIYIRALEKDFIEEGGYSEQLAAARLAERERIRKQNSHPSDPSDPSDRSCPICGKPMVLRTAKKGKSAGKQFMGCSDHPACKGLIDI